MKISQYNLGFVGFGHLAKVIYQQIDSCKLIDRSQILFRQRDPQKMRENEMKYGISSTSMAHLVEKSDVLLLAVRPHQAESILSEIASLGAKEKKIITVMAGIQFPFYQKFLGEKVEILRAMPNLASSVGEGMTVLSYSRGCSDEFRSLGHVLFQSMGHALELDEKLMDITVGVSGSGPGFVLKLIEAMARAGEKGGICYEKALMMAAQTFLGAAKLVLKGQNPQNLTEQIAVPNGTTEAGFNVMKQTHVETHFQQAIDAATRRSRELSEEFR